MSLREFPGLQALTWTSRLIKYHRIEINACLEKTFPWKKKGNSRMKKTNKNKQHSIIMYGCLERKAICKLYGSRPSKSNKLNNLIKKWNINISFASYYILFLGAGVKYSRTAVNERHCISLFEGKKTENNKESLLWNSKASNLLPFSVRRSTLLIKWPLTDDSWTGPSLTNVLDGTSSGDNGDVVSEWVFMRMLPASIVELKKDISS